MKRINLGKITTCVVKKYLVLALSEEWLSANDGKPLVFDAKLTLDGKLELCAQISNLSHNSKDVDTNET